MTVFQNVWQSIRLITVMDVIDILIVTVLLYNLIRVIRHTSAERLLKGIFVLLIVLQIATWAGLYIIKFLLNTLMQVGFLALVIVFQPELRKMLEQFGRSHISSRLRLFKNDPEEIEKLKRAIVQVVDAVSAMSWSKTGALIVFEKIDSLSSIAVSGTQLDAEVSSELIKNIFFPKSPLHDGAVIIAKGRVRSAGCLLPLSTNLNISKELGTRHRAAIGITEAYDAPCVVVSEETGTISYVSDGVIKRHLAPETLERFLLNELISTPDEREQKVFRFFRGKDK